MAIYHLHVQTIGRGAGRSAVAAAAYRSTTRLTDQETGIICDYTKKDKAVDSGILAPHDSPKWVWEREKLWNEVQKKENRKNSQFAWEYDLAFPEGVKNYSMVGQFCRDNFLSKGLICDYAVHKPSKKGDERNWHVHIMVTTRQMTENGWGEKYRRGENKQSDRAAWLKEVRQSWEDICNERLETIGSKERVSCKTLEAQGIDRQPQSHQGPTATAMERKGKKPDRTREKKETFIDSIQPEEQFTANLPDVWKEGGEKDRELREAEVKLEVLQDVTKFEEILRNDELRAEGMATRGLLPEIEEASNLEIERTISQRSNLTRQQPQGVVAKPNAIKNFFTEWHTADGKIFQKWEDYAKHQQGLINAWEKKWKPLDDREKGLTEEQNLIAEVRKDGEENSVGPINRLLKLSREQERRRPPIFEKIKAGAAGLLEKAREFSGFRNLKKIVEEVKTDLKIESKERMARERKSPRQDQGWSR